MSIRDEARARASQAGQWAAADDVPECGGAVLQQGCRGLAGIVASNTAYLQRATAEADVDAAKRRDRPMWVIIGNISKEKIPCQASAGALGVEVDVVFELRAVSGSRLA